MATKSATVIIGDDGVMRAAWLAVTESDTGAGVRMSGFPDRTVQAAGDFTSSGAITMEGSNDGTNYSTLHDPQGVAIVLTDTALKLIAEVTDYIRPRATAGTAVSMNVYVQGSK